MWASVFVIARLTFGLVLIVHVIVHVTSFVAISSQAIKIFATNQT